MRKPLLALVVAAATAAAGGVVAQPRPARPHAPPAAPAPVPTPAPAPAPAASAGQPGETAPAAPRPLRTEILNLDNWTVNCQEFADKRRVCTATLQVAQAQSGQVLFVWIIGRNTDNRLMSVLQTPTGVMLAPGVEVKLPRGPSRKAHFVNCEASRCEATLEADDAFIKDATGAENVDATVVSTTGQSVKFTLPFKGLDRALAALK